MKYLSFLKSLFHWKFFLNILMIIGLFLALIFGTLQYLSYFTHHDEKIEVPNISKFNIFDAKTALDKANLKYEIDTFKYDTLYKPFQIIDVYPKEGSFVKMGRRIFIRANPKTWRPVEVPNLIDNSKYKAFTQLKLVGLQVGNTILEPYKYPDLVIKMLYKGKVIKPGTPVPRFSKISLVIGQKLDSNVSMPSVLGLSLNEAKEILEQNYYEVGMKTFFGVKDSITARVFYQSPLAGDISDQGMQVDLWLSEQSQDNLQSEIGRLNNIYNKKMIIDSAGILKTLINIDSNTPKDVNPNEQKSSKPKNKINPQSIPENTN